MADLVLSDGTNLTNEKLMRILLGGIHPSARRKTRGGASHSTAWHHLELLLTKSLTGDLSLPPPVILIHGFADIPSLTGSWKLVEKFLSESGVEYFTPQIPPYGGIEERSIALIGQIASQYPGRTVHLFGHSMVG